MQLINLILISSMHLSTQGDDADYTIYLAVRTICIYNGDGDSCDWKTFIAQIPTKYLVKLITRRLHLGN